eukprot:10418841-Prorocentrum_lima.AAC.1
MTSSLVGSEMCIRDRSRPCFGFDTCSGAACLASRNGSLDRVVLSVYCCLLYTSDAADDM